MDESSLMSPSAVLSLSLLLTLLLLVINFSRRSSLSRSIRLSVVIFNLFLNMLYQGLPPLRCNSLKSLINQFLNFSQCKSLNTHYKTKALSNLFHTFCCSFLHVLSLDSRSSLLDLTHSGQLAILLLGGLSLYTVQLISKLTLACGNTHVFLYFCRVTRTELTCDTRVIFCVEHASSISYAARDSSSCAARL